MMGSRAGSDRELAGVAELERPSAVAERAPDESLLQAVLESLPFDVWLTDADGRYSMQNAIGRRIWGDHIGLLPQQTQVEPEIVRVWLEGNRRALAGEVVRAEQAYTHEGQTFHVEEILAPVKGRDGQLLGFLGINLDISERKRAEAELREREASLRAAIDSLPFGFWMRDRNGGLVMQNALAQIYCNCPGGSGAASAPVPPDAAASWLDTSQRVLAGETVRQQVTCEVEGELRRLERVVVPVTRDHAVVGLMGIEVDVTERVRAEEHIRRLALLDGLTELPNRTLLLDRLEQALALGRRRGGNVAVMLLDLDQFKDVNDTLGHPAGDRLLCLVAERIRGCVRATDTLARLGGDEFALLQLDVGSPADAAALAGKILAAFGTPFDLGDQEVDASVSIGIALARNGEADGSTLLRHADLALYRAKAEGRARYRFFEPGMDAAAHARREIERDLRRALERDELVLHFQPQLALATGRPVGAEALLRWRHPERGLLLPSEFMAVAEATGLIRPLGAWVLEEACRQARHWRDRGHHLRVAVNLSGAQLRHAQLGAIVGQALARSGLDAGALELELVEEVLGDGSGTDLAATLRELAATGVRLVIDDFGVGHSSLADLCRLPVHKIKIDRTFVAQLAGDDETVSLVGAIVGLGRSLRCLVSAEGVETELQLRRLRDLGCDEAQGFLLGSPRPAAAFDPASTAPMPGWDQHGR